MESVGQHLKRERELRDISLADVVKATKINLRYIEAIETDQFELLPGKAFVIGFLKNYAQCIGLDEDEVVTRYLDFENEKNGEEAPKKSKIEDVPKKKKSFIGPFFIFMIFAVAAFLIYYFFNLAL